MQLVIGWNCSIGAGGIASCVKVAVQFHHGVAFFHGLGFIHLNLVVVLSRCGKRSARHASTRMVTANLELRFMLLPVRRSL
jgi:hypothetical protein